MSAMPCNAFPPFFLETAGIFVSLLFLVLSPFFAQSGTDQGQVRHRGMDGCGDTESEKESAFQPVAGRAEEKERCGCGSILHLPSAETESRLNTHALSLSLSLSLSPSQQRRTTEMEGEEG